MCQNNKFLTHQELNYPRQACWYKPMIPRARETEAGGSQVQGKYQHLSENRIRMDLKAESRVRLSGGMLP